MVISAMVAIVPSILSYDQCELLRGVRIAEECGAQRLHIDIMDGVFVDNISFGPQIVHDLRRHTSLKLDVHLMLQQPVRFIERFIEAGADNIAIHQESSGEIIDLLSIIRQNHRTCALAINPGTSPMEELLPIVDEVVVMGVHPGFGGQKFIPETMNTITSLVEYRKNNGLNYQIAVDGGVTIGLAPQLAEIGTDIIISGNSFFRAPQQFVHSLRRYLE